MVLVVEDEILIRMVIAEYLRDCGYAVIEAGSGREAMAIFEASLEIDTVFTDVQMPGDMDGFALTRWVHANHPDTSVTLTSGVAKAADAAAELCRDGPLMQKPYEAAEVERRIKQLLAMRARSRSN